MDFKDRIKARRLDLNSSYPLSCHLFSSVPRDANRKALETQISLLDRKLSRARDSYAAGIDTLDEYRKFHDEIIAEKSDVQRQLDALSATMSQDEISTALRDGIRSTLETIESATASKELKNSAVREIIDSCVWDKSISTLTITYRLCL